LLTQQANDIILFFDEHLNVIECNDTAVSTYGYARHELIGMNIEKLRARGKKEAIVEQDKEAIRSNNRIYETVDIRKDGSKFAVEVSANLVEVDGKQYYQHIVRDVSQRKLIEEKLFAEQEFIRTLLDNTSDAMVGFDRTGAIVLFNKLAKSWFLVGDAISPADNWLNNITVHDAFGNPYAPENNPLVKVCKGQYLQNEELTILSPEGPLRHILASGGPFHDQQGVVLGAVTVMHDITEQTILQRQISEEKRFTEKVINASPSIIYIFDLIEAKNVFANEGIETILGYSKSDIQTMGARILPLLMHPDDFKIYSEQTLARYQTMVEHEQIEQSFRMKRKDGEWRWLLTRESIFKRLPSGEPQQILGVTVDVTEERNRQILLAKREDILQRTGMMAKIGGWEFDPRTGEGSWTDEVARIHDLDPATATSAAFGLTFYHGIYKEMISAAINDAVKLGKPYDLELELISAKGVKKWIRTKGQPVKEKDEVILLSGIFQDITEQKNTEFAYRNSEQNYYELFNNMLDGFIYCKVIYSDKVEATDALVLSANSRFLQLIEKKNAIGEKLTELLPDIITPPSEFSTLLASVSYSGIPGKIEMFFPKLGKWFTISVYSKESGHFAAILDDSTERKLSEEKIRLLNAELEKKIIERTAQLHDSEERFTKIFYLSPVGIIIANIADGKILDLNESYAEMSGFRREELINSTAAELGILPKAERHELMVELKTRGKIRHHEMQICSKSGKIIDVSLSMEKITLGNEDYVVSIVNDITTRKQIENQIKQISERYVLATASAKVGIWEWDIVTNKLIWDDRLYSLHGVTREQFPSVLDSWIRCLHPEDEKRVIAELWGAVEGKCDYTPQFRTMWPDGSIHHIQAHGVVSRAADGTPLYMLGTGWDITAEMEARQQLQELNVSLQIKEASLMLANKELEAFSYSVSHDLRAPLRAIDGFAKMLSEEFSSVINDEALRLLSVIIQNTTKMGSLIDDLLAFSRLSRQKSKIVSIPMNQLVSTVIEDFAPLFDFAKIRIEVLDLPDIVGDTAMLRQVWRNLIGNALKFSSKVSEPIIRISAKGDGITTTYSVQDNGVGFDMQYAAKLFGVFQRLHATNEFEGTGVGLAIVQRIVHRFGGSIYAESQPNKGATFYFTLPNNLEIDHGN
jgi:PAS domain S-box-containing protein